MEKLGKLQRNTLVLVCDGRKAIFLVNDGPAMAPDLNVREIMNSHPAAEPSDRPGRRPDRVGAEGGKGSLSAMEMPDPHKQELETFSQEVADKLARKIGADAPHSIVIAAPPDVLGALRKHMPKKAQPLIEAEFAKDLTHMTVEDITAAILDI